MKKLIPLLLVLMSVGLHSQEAKYWEKIDFQFDSGIKQIDMFQNHDGYWNVINNSFILLDSNNNIYYFSSVYNTPILVNTPDSNITISKVKIVCEWKTTLIFVITEDKKLMLTKDFGASWKLFNYEIDNSEVTDIAVYWNYYGLPIDKIYLCISNVIGEVYLNMDLGDSWQKIINGLQNEKINQLIENTYDDYICALTESNKLYNFNKELNSWNLLVDLNENMIIKELRLIFLPSSYAFLDKDNNLKYKEGYEDIRTIGDSIEITCFTISKWMYLASSFQLNQLPDGNLIIFGTNQKGIFLSCDWSGNYYEPEQYGEELKDKKITDIETNSLTCPSICLVGTDNGEVYFSEFHYEPGIVTSFQNTLHTQISPQPTSTKARLSFTLPMESRVSVKIYNTLGIEPFAIDDDFFSEGENSIPLDVSGLADGMYFVAIQYEGKTVVEKLVVRR